MSIQKQVEFYFSDSNFRGDKFLREKAAEDEEGFVPISTLLTFNRLKTLTTDPKEVSKAVEHSETVVVSDDGLRIRRKEPLADDVEEAAKERTLYVKGFPEGDAGADVTIESVTEQFKTFGNVLMVRLRKDPVTKAFKGSCFIEFDNVDAVNKAVADSHDSEGKVTLMYKEEPFLCVMPLVQWLANKAAKRNRRQPSGGEKRKREGNDENEGDSKADDAVEFTKGQIVKVSNVPSEATLFNIKDKFKSICNVRYVEYESGDSVAYVRLQSPDDATKAISAIKEGLKLLEGEDEIELGGDLLEGDEETAYWKKITKNSRAKKGKGGGRGRGFKRGRR